MFFLLVEQCRMCGVIFRGMNKFTSKRAGPCPSPVPPVMFLPMDFPKARERVNGKELRPESCHSTPNSFIILLELPGHDYQA
jgi:hypothetical protein